MPATFLRAYPPAQPTSTDAYWFPFHNDKLLVREIVRGVVPLQGGEELEHLVQLRPGSRIYIGMLNDISCLACDAQLEMLPEGIRELSLRELYGQIDEMLYGVVVYAFQLLYWQRTSNFCPVCGHIPTLERGTWGKQCLHCGHVAYPHVTPAILALVHDDEGNMLLTHKRGWGKRYSCVAGFVEPGESLEECVQREVREELGVEVADVSYIGSQPWPFPHQLMVGYTARYVSGELRIDEHELDDARWFSVANPPDMPPSMSLAHTIIRTWIQAHR